jgi:peroxiredoxin
MSEMLVRIQPQQTAPPFTAPTAQGGVVTLQQFAGKPLLLKFHRYASCPMCNLKLHDFARHYPALHERGLEAVAFFHTPVEQIRAHAGRRKYPFALAADPEFQIYRRYGVQTSWSRLGFSVVLPSFYWDWLRAMRHGFWGGMPPWQLAKIPADFLIAPDGRILLAHYGRHIGDHLPISDIGRFLR